MNKRADVVRVNAIQRRIAEALRNALARQEMTRLELAERSGVTNTYITLIMQGKANMKLETIVKLEIGLGCAILDIKTKGHTELKT